MKPFIWIVITLTIKEVQVIVNLGGGEQGEGKDQVYMWRPHLSSLILCKLCILLMGCGTAANRSGTSLLTQSVYQRGFRSPGEVPKSYPCRSTGTCPLVWEGTGAEPELDLLSSNRSEKKQKLSAVLILVAWFLLGRDLVSINSWAISSLTHSINFFPLVLLCDGTEAASFLPSVCLQVNNRWKT